MPDVSAGDQAVTRRVRLQHLGYRRALKLGSHRARVRATDPAGNRSALRTVKFTIVLARSSPTSVCTDLNQHR